MKILGATPRRMRYEDRLRRDGGDYAPKNTVEEAVLALKEYPYIEKLFLVGDAVATGNELRRLDFKDARIEIFHASEVVSMKESAAKAVCHKKDASICRAVDLD